MRINLRKIFLCGAYLALLCAVGFLGVCDFAAPDSITIFSGESLDDINGLPFLDLDFTESAAAALAEYNCDVKQPVTNVAAETRLFGIIPLKNVNVSVVEKIKLYPGGMPFGVKFYTKGVLVVGISEVETVNGNQNPAYDAGLRIKDIILKINGNQVNTIEEVTESIENSDGKSVALTVHRNNEDIQIIINPVYSSLDGKYKAGIWIRDSTAGIGTITFINPADNTFAGLGHGICDVDTGELMPLMRGNIYDVTISGVTKGQAGYPGELKGYFNPATIGALTNNTESGVHGILSSLPKEIPSEALPIGLKRDVTEGEAFIYCTTDSNTVKKYTVQIIKINRTDNDLKNFIIKITDPELLEATGGIVQGMSGSPVIQNGRLIGAVTHVLINDPTKGYGTFIENMLKTENAR